MLNKHMLRNKILPDHIRSHRSGCYRNRSKFFLSRLKVLIPVASVLVVLTLYLFTMEDDISWAHFGGDGGELITASYTLGIPHPPGYPTYVLLGKLFSLIPLGTIAFRYNLFSAVSMALAAGIVTAIAAKKSLKVQSNTGAILLQALAWMACGLSFAFVPIVWQQSLIAEVYALQALFLAGLLWATLTERRPALIGFLLGLSISGHLTSILFIPLVILLVPKKSWPGLAVGTTIGLLPLLALPILHGTGSPVSWGEPNTIKGWWWLVSGRLYSPNAFAVSPAAWPARMVAWGPAVTLPLMILTFANILGLITDVPKDRKRKATILLVTAIAIVGYSLAYATSDSFVYLIPAVLLLSINISLFLPRLKMMAMFIPLLLLILANPVISTPATMDVRAEAEKMLAGTPKHAILLTGGDQTVAALWYFHHVENSRSDIILIDENMFQFPWYRQRIQDNYPYLTKLEEDDVPGFVTSNQQYRPVCRVSFVGRGYYTCVDSKERRDFR